MQINYAFIRSKVARRVIWLFFISALVPIAITAAYSFTYVNDLLVNQSYQQLQHASKLYGMAVLDRLLFVDSKLRQMSHSANLSPQLLKTILEEEKQTLPNASLVEKPIRKLSIRILNDQGALDINNAEKSSIFASIDQDGVTRIYIRRIVGMNKSNNIVALEAQLNNQFLWGNKDTLPFSTYLCILDEAGKVLFCPNQESKTLLAKIRDNAKNADPRKIVWSNQHGTFLAVAWDLFIKSNFAGSDWKIISSRPVEDALLPLYAYHKIFPLIIILSLLGVMLLSLIQVRRIMLPLEKLVKATGRLARYEFGEPVEVSSSDEFGELADSFNIMAARLEKQFNTLKVLSDIDHLILSYPDLEVVLSNIFDTANKIVACDYIVVTLFNNSGVSDGWTYIKEVSGNKPAYVERTVIEQEEIQRLQEQKEVQLRDVISQPLFCMEPVVKLGVSTAQVCPIFLDGEVRAVFCLGYRAGAENNIEDVGLISDIIDRLAVALATADRDEKLYRQAHYDFLTGLPNRQLFNDRLQQHIIRVRRNNEKTALLYVDLDRFKNINDSLGHASGDLLLRKVAERMRNAVRETDTVSRLGGDEFVVLLASVGSPKDVRYIVENLIEEISRPYNINGREIFINASVGIVIYPEDGKDNKELLAHADAAMYHAKESGRGRYMFYEESMNREIIRRIEMETALRHALERKEFFLLYQPQIEPLSGKVMAIEALIRWNHPKLGIVKPTQFIPLAEESGLIEPIGEWVLENACLNFRRMQTQNLAPASLAVNISSRQFMRGDFIELVEHIILESGISPNELELEITESLLLDESINTRSMFNRLGAMGVKLAIDDFGTGYSSLGYLKRFPIHTLKIDRAFTRDIPADNQATTLTLSIIAMAHALNMLVVAEGVETGEQLELLRKNNCDFVQGNYFSEPLTIDELFIYLRRQGTISMSGN